MDEQLKKPTELADLKASLGTYLLPGSAPPNKRLLRSGLACLDGALQGGLPFGKLCEWGLPPGRQGRNLLLQFLAQERPLTLWIYGGEAGLEVYPPAWQAQGIDLQTIYFVKSSAPVRELRPVFLEPLFEVLILDAPTHCSKEDQAFLAKQAKALGQGIFILRPYFLTHERGNPLAPLRLNSWYEPTQESYQLETLRGFPPACVAIPAAGLGRGYLYE